VASLKERLATEMRQALKAGEKVRLSALRMLAAAVKYREVELRHELSDDEVVEVATREIKRRAEAIEAYEKADRPDRAALEREEMGTLQAYVPEGLSDEDVNALIDGAIAATGATAPGDMGKVMKLVMSEAKGRVDGRTVQERVRARLAGG
jgi:uncharacterized protein YqeY